MNTAQDPTTLVIFCRRPEQGVGKQRIAAELGQRAALAVSELLIATTMEDATAWQGQVILSPARPTDTAWAAELLKDAMVIPQPEGNLGQRIEAVHVRAQQAGNARIILIGTDAPALTPEELVMAANSLNTYDTVIIPARDGGVTLLGTSRQWPPLDTLPWETSRLGEALVRRCRAAGHHVCVLSTSSDLDTRQDLVDLYPQLRTDQRPARIALCNWIEQAGLLPVPQTKEPGISVIVPVLDDFVALQHLLGCLAKLEPAVDEIVVVDGSTSNNCEQLCANHEAVYLRTEANRGKQLKQGAQASTGDILWFLHADSTPDDNSAATIRQHLKTGRLSGYFRFRFDGPDRWYKSALAHAINFRARIGIPYGDQGLFATREAYFAAGAHAETALFEEVPLIKGLRALTECSAATGTLTVSSRRWERDGWLRRSLHNRALAIAFALGVAPEKLARNYGSATGNRQRADRSNA